MKEIKYKITFHSFWHIGSGEGRGADLDALVLKDSSGFPYIPGKTLKGLFRDSLQTMNEIREGVLQDKIHSIFGLEGKETGKCYFSNAALPDNLKNQISDPLKLHLYKKHSSTAIDSSTGVADAHSLRSIEVTIPIELEGSILNVDEDSYQSLKESLLLTKYIGAGRNKGFGRCSISISEKEGSL